VLGRDGCCCRHCCCCCWQLSSSCLTSRFSAPRQRGLVRWWEEKRLIRWMWTQSCCHSLASLWMAVLRQSTSRCRFLLVRFLCPKLILLFLLFSSFGNVQKHRLVELCRGFGLPHSGNMKTLRGRLQEFSGSREEWNRSGLLYISILCSSPSPFVSPPTDFLSTHEMRTVALEMATARSRNHKKSQPSVAKRCSKTLRLLKPCQLADSPPS
jgi:hypothetical protein